MNVLLKRSRYVFNPASRTLTFVGMDPVLLEQIYAIYNVTDGACLYDFGNPQLGGTLTNNVLTLACDTTSMSATDALLVRYDDGAQQGVDYPIRTIDESIPLLRRIVRQLEASGNVDAANRQRVVIDAITGALTLAAVTTVGTVSTVGNVATIAGWDQRQFADNNRTAYNTGIRANITFS